MKSAEVSSVEDQLAEIAAIRGVLKQVWADGLGFRCIK